MITNSTQLFIALLILPVGHMNILQTTILNIAPCPTLGTECDLTEMNLRLTTHKNNTAP